MLTEERHHIILDLLSHRHTVKLKELTTALASSDSTVRRDLDELEKKGLLKRVHGGAMASERSFAFDHTISERNREHMEEKRKIGQYCASLIQDGEFIYLDSGTTTSEIIPFLKGKNVTVVTNGLYNVEKLIEFNIPSYILAGKIKPVTKTIIGEAAILSLKQFHFNKAFIGANGITASASATTPDVSEAVLKNQAIQQAVHSYLVVDSGKFGNVSFSKICNLSDVDIITDLKKESMDKRITKQTIVHHVE